MSKEDLKLTVSTALATIGDSVARENRYEHLIGEETADQLQPLFDAYIDTLNPDTVEKLTAIMEENTTGGAPYHGEEHLHLVATLLPGIKDNSPMLDDLRDYLAGYKKIEIS